jgi:SpoIID/LytB domain protein
MSLLLSALLLTTLAGPATAAGSASPPAEGQAVFEGRGFGHGRGMSQWGAYGAADAGQSWRQITEFYYPGTTRQVTTNSSIRVLISADEGRDVRVDPGHGLSVSAKSGKVVLPTGAQFESWRVIRRASGLVLQRLSKGTWADHPVVLGADASFTASSGLLRLVLPDGTRQELRGSVRAVSYSTSPSVRTVAVMPMEAYLRSVVPAEMPAGWPDEALRAQAVAARSYAARLRSSAAGKAWDTCDTQACQVFVGTAHYRADGSLIKRGEHARTDTAIAATAGTVLMHRSTPALTEFGAANGGYSAAGGSTTPYLVAKKDPYDGRIPSTAHAWSVTVPASKVEKAFPTVGNLQKLTVKRRSGQGEWGGRVLEVTVTGSRGSTTVTGDKMRSALGLRSNWFLVKSVSVAPAKPVTAPKKPPAVRKADFTRDDRVDVLTRTKSGSLLLYPGNGKGGFAKRKQVGTGWNGMTALVSAGDVTGDGNGDVHARDKAGRLWLYPGNGKSGWGKRVMVGKSGWNSMTALVAASDMNRDGRHDLLSRDRQGRLWLYPGNGKGGFGKRVLAGKSGWNVMTALVGPGDFTGDGSADLLARDTSGRLWLYPGNGKGSFGKRKQIGTGWNGMTALLSVGDFSGDRQADLLARDRAGKLWLYPGTGKGTLGKRTQVGSGWGSFSAIT